MKKIALLFLLSGVAAIKSLSAQTVDHVKLSDQYPAAGEKISLTYSPEGTVLAGKTDITAVVYFLDNKDYPVADIDLKASGKMLTGSFTVPATAKAFYIKLSKDEDIDANNDLGYVYFVYADKKPVEGAYASKGYMLFSGMGAALAKIKTNAPEALSLYKKEFETYPQSKKEYRATYATLLMGSADPAVKASADVEIAQLAQSGDEKEMTAAVGLLGRQKKVAKADSLTAVIKAKFPEGTAVKQQMGLAILKEKDPAKKEVLLADFISKFPQDATEKKPVQDSYRAQIAAAYLTAGKYDDYARVSAQVKDKANLAGGLNAAAWAMALKGENLDEAAKLSKESLDYTKEKINNPGAVAYQSPKAMKKSYEFTYDEYADTYAYILFKQNKLKEAYEVQKTLYDHQKEPDAELTLHYALILKGLGEDKKAMQISENSVKNGRSSTSVDSLLKILYAKTKGSDKGYDVYSAALDASAMQVTKNKLAKQMINKPAAMFALKDFDGKTVSLADLKGKVVIVDFWATWCGPCKASFPGMQMAVTKYKDNPNVKFLFIDTWERVEDFMPGVKKFIADNKYTFNVLFDEKGGDGRQSKVVSEFGVEGIPTKFIIDGNGTIRFKYVGFSGTSKAVVDEVSAMIDMAMHPETVPGGEKVTMLKTK